MRLILYRLIFSLVVVSTPVTGFAFSTTLVEADFDWARSDDGIVGLASNGDMAIAQPADDDSTLSLWIYQYTQEQWYGKITLEHTAVDAAETMVISNLAVVPAQKSWLITWQVTHYDSDDTYLATTYQIAHVSRNATELDTTIPEMISSASVSENGGSIYSVGTSGDVSDPFVLWADGDTINIAAFNGSTRIFTSQRTLESVLDPTDYKLTTIDDSLYITWVTATSKMMTARLTNTSEDVLTVNFKRTSSADARSHPLHAVIGQDNQVFILYQMGDELKRIEVNANGSLGDRDTVLSNVAEDLNSYNVGVMYNDYGKGQYDVVVFDGEKISLAHWRAHAKWTRDDDFATGDTLNMYKFPDGHIQYVWSNSGKLYYKEYDPDTKEWTEALRLEKKYGSLTLQSPVEFYPLQSSDEATTVQLFERTPGSQEQLRLWKLGTAFDQTTGKVWLPQKHSLIFRERIGQYYFMLFQKGDQMRSAVIKETQLFDL